MMEAAVKNETRAVTRLKRALGEEEEEVDNT